MQVKKPLTAGDVKKAYEYLATHLMSNGADIQAVKALLGHSSLAATQVYMHNSAERLKKIYNQAHPKAQRTKPDMNG